MHRAAFASGTLLALGLIASGAANATELRGRVGSRNPYILIVNGLRFALNVTNAPSQDVAPVLVP